MSAESTKSIWRSAGSAASPRQWMERAIALTLAACAGVSVLTTVGVVFVLLIESIPFFGEVSVLEFLTGTKWTPLLRPQHFGILPLLCGTLWIAVGSGIFALPLGLATAVYLSEYARPLTRDVVKPALEVLAGIPSVVYGYFAVVAVSPLVRWLFPNADVFNVVSASIVVGIMILPTVVSLSEDVLRAVPRALREGAYALGSTKLDVTVRVVIPSAASGIMASFLLALSRAIGETMAVTLAAGATPQITLNPLKSVQTMTAYIVQISQGDTPAGTIEYRTIFVVGLALFVLTLGMNVLAQYVLSRFREVYE